ncbi:MAG: CBS domain-containing protein [Myxococcales bacterium]|nr:CBS domain-containing protein [Myxococcales bacterium]
MTMSDMQKTTVGEVMSTKLSWAKASMPIADLTALLIDEGVSAAPVLDDARRPIGIITKTDLVKLGDCGARTVAELMTTTTYSLQESTSIADAIATMGFEGIHHAPVVNDDGTVTGMLSSVDLLRWIAQREGYKPAASGTRRAFDHG